MHFRFSRQARTALASLVVAACVATPATALEARQAFAFMVATYEQTADQCNYADSVRTSMERLDRQYAASDPAGWGDLKSRGVSALGHLEGIMPLNMDWDSCSSVGDLLADWAPIAAVSLAMEGAESGIASATSQRAADPANVDQIIVDVINGQATSYAPSAEWTFRSLDGETQGGCRMSTPLDSTTQLIVMARPGDQTQFGIATSNSGILDERSTRLAATIDGRALTTNEPETNHASLAWFAGNGSDLAEQIKGGRMLEISLNGFSFRLLVEGFAADYGKLAACSANSLSIATPTDLLGRG